MRFCFIHSTYLAKRKREIRKSKRTLHRERKLPFRSSPVFRKQEKARSFFPCPFPSLFDSELSCQLLHFGEEKRGRRDLSPSRKIKKEEGREKEGEGNSEWVSANPSSLPSPLSHGRSKILPYG